MAANTPGGPPTKRQRVQNFLAYGFIISVALHLVFGPLVKMQRTQPEEEKVSVIKRDVVPTPPPTPPPTPKPTPTPPPTPPPKQTPPPVKHTPQPVVPKIKINTAKSTAHRGGPSERANTHTEGSINGVPQGTSTGPATTPVPVVATTAAPAPPTPVPTKPPTCAQPNVAPHVVNAVQPDTPPIAQQQGITGEVSVLVTLDSNSKLSGAPSIQKSPSAVLNGAALRAARDSTYQTEIANCVPKAATYVFVVEFNSQ
ncbi:MAG: energy transducer TonB [Candidatus Velthaea sp.]